MFRLAEACSHIGAILFKIEAAVRLGYTKQAACTDVTCKWNNDFVKKITGTKIQHVDFYDVKTTLKSKLPTDRFKHANNAEKSQLLGMISKVPKKDTPIVFSSFASHCQSFVHKAPVPATHQLPKPLHSFYRRDLSEEEIAKRFADVHELKLTNEQRDFIQKATVLQSASLSWKSVRVGRITASTVHEVLHTNQKNPSKHF